LGLALEALRDGRVEIALAGGADGLCRLTFGGFNALQSVDEVPCRPFRAARRGLSLGEGAAVLVLERAERAAERGAEPLAALLGSGASADAYHMTAPEPRGRGAAEAIERALADAGQSVSAVDFINAHGTGTELNDAAEYQALARVFGARLRTLPLTSTKASIGHLLGSAGAIEAAATVLALQDQRLQPTAGAGDLDERTPVCLTTASAPADLGVALSLNLGFGGCNGALVLARAGAS
jgi:3-oxoacyl-[acyl-carrier-protein] synthase II